MLPAGFFAHIPRPFVQTKDMKHDPTSSISLFGLSYFCGTRAEACEAILSLFPRGGAVFTPNAEMAERALYNAHFHDTLSSAELLLPDGMGVVIGARIRGGGRLTRLPGVEVAEALIADGTPTFLLGGRPGVADMARARLASRYRKAHIIGAADGYFTPAEEEARLRAIRESGARLLLVGLGSPRQEEWILAHRAALPATVMIGVGGSLDIYAGTKRRAPRPIQRLGLEWLYRLSCEPWRIARICRIPLFFLRCLFEKSEKAVDFHRNFPYNK